MAENKVTEELLKLFENLGYEEWNIELDSGWTIKDVLSHLAGWEEEYAASLADSWTSKKPPWFLKTDNYDDFDRMFVERYISCNAFELVERWKYLMKVFESEIRQIGIDRLKAKPELFDWIFDEKHYLEHLNQIKKVLSKSLIKNKNI